MKKLLRSVAASAAVLGVSISPGIALANHSNTAVIDTTGSGSTNLVTTRNNSSVDTTNRTTLRATNNNPQTATSGDVNLFQNTTTQGGSAESGSATNDGLFSATATVNNNDCGCNGTGAGTGAASTSGTIDTTGANSNNQILFENNHTVVVDNATDIQVTNNNAQSAQSGSVNLTQNTVTGGATSGDASNISTTIVDFEVNN